MCLEIEQTTNWEDIATYVKAISSFAKDSKKEEHQSILFSAEEYRILFIASSLSGERQAVIDGELVRRHVADILMREKKPVYGVFIANKIDSNTAETFRIGCWFNQKDEELSLQIVPFTLTQFAKFFKHMFTTQKHTPDTFLQLFNECFAAKQVGKGPVWKREIEQIVEKASA